MPQTSIVRLEIYIQKMKGKGGEKCLKQIKYIIDGNINNLRERNSDKYLENCLPDFSHASH